MDETEIEKALSELQGKVRTLALMAWIYSDKLAEQKKIDGLARRVMEERVEKLDEMIAELRRWKGADHGD